MKVYISVNVEGMGRVPGRHQVFGSGALLDVCRCANMDVNDPVETTYEVGVERENPG